LFGSCSSSAKLHKGNGCVKQHISGQVSSSSHQYQCSLHRIVMACSGQHAVATTQGNKQQASMLVAEAGPWYVTSPNSNDLPGQCCSLRWAAGAAGCAGGGSKAEHVTCMQVSTTMIV
jgi:hypothetical protein